MYFFFSFIYSFFFILFYFSIFSSLFSKRDPEISLLHRYVLPNIPSSHLTPSRKKEKKKPKIYLPVFYIQIRVPVQSLESNHLH